MTIDEEIARLRGWAERPDEHGCEALQSTPGTQSADDRLYGARAYGPRMFPPYSSSPALSWMLLIELIKANAWDGGTMVFVMAEAEIPGEVVACCWLMAKKDGRLL